MIDDKQRGLRAGRGCADQIFILKEIGKKAQEKKCSVCGFYRPRVKESESECFRIDRGETGMHHVPLAFQCIYGSRDERGELGDGEEGSEISGVWWRMQIAQPLLCR